MGDSGLDVLDRASPDPRRPGRGRGGGGDGWLDRRFGCGDYRGTGLL